MKRQMCENFEDGNVTEESQLRFLVDFTLVVGNNWPGNNLHSV